MDLKDIQEKIKELEKEKNWIEVLTSSLRIEYFNMSFIPAQACLK